MDFSKLTLGSKVIAGAGILLLLDSFRHRQEVSFGPISAGVTMWHGWGVFIGIVLLAILAWEGAQLADVKIAVGPLSPSMVTVLLSGLLVLFTLIKVLSNDYVASWAWIGLVLSVVVAVGAWLNMQAAGESLADLKTSIAPGAASPPPPPAEPAETPTPKQAPGLRTERPERVTESGAEKTALRGPFPSLSAANRRKTTVLCPLRPRCHSRGAGGP